MKRLSILAAIVIAILVTTSVFSATAVFAQTPTPTPTPYPKALYQITVSCGDHNVLVSKATFTADTTPVPGGLQSTIECTADETESQVAVALQAWNDLEIEYQCPKGPPTGTLNIPPNGVTQGKWYKLDCPPPTASTPGPTPDLTQDAAVKVEAYAVGGIAEASDVDASALGATASGGSSGTTYAVIAGIVAGALMLGAGGWYARRRWLS